MSEVVSSCNFSFAIITCTAPYLDIANALRVELFADNSAAVFNATTVVLQVPLELLQSNQF